MQRALMRQFTGFLGMEPFLERRDFDGTNAVYSSSPSCSAPTNSCICFPFFSQPAPPSSFLSFSTRLPGRPYPPQTPHNDVFQQQRGLGSCFAGISQPAFLCCSSAASPLCGDGWGCHRVRLLCLLSHTPPHPWMSPWACSGPLMAMRGAAAPAHPHWPPRSCTQTRSCCRSC